MNPTVIAMRRPVTTLMMVVALISGGVLAYSRMRVDIFPSLNVPKIYVFLDYIGMSPDQMEGFIVNELERINRELRANFDLWAFGLRSFYNEELGRVEIYLESLRPQSVEIRQFGLSIDFKPGERIHVENAYKFDVDGLRILGNQTGFALEKTWCDKRRQFSSNLFRSQQPAG